MRRAGAIAVLGAAGVAAGVLVGTQVAGSLEAHAPQPVVSTQPADGMVLYRDRADALTLSVPQGWWPVPHDDPGVKLAMSDQRGAALQLRTARLPFTARDVRRGRLRRLAVRSVAAGRTVRFATEPRTVAAGGFRGWAFLYTFRDAASGRRGVHEHYVLFRGRRMVSLVFQALPEARFRAAAPVFDRVAATLQATDASS